MYSLGHHTQPSSNTRPFSQDDEEYNVIQALANIATASLVTGNRRQSLLVTTHPCCPLVLHIRSHCRVSRFHPALLMRPHRCSYLIINFATNPRRRLFQPNSRRFIVISPSSSQMSLPIQANPKLRAVSSSWAVHPRDARRHDGRKRF